MPQPRLLHLAVLALPAILAAPGPVLSSGPTPRVAASSLRVRAPVYRLSPADLRALSGFFDITGVSPRLLHERPTLDGRGPARRQLTWGGAVGSGPLGPMVDRTPGLRLASLAIPWGLLRGALSAPKPPPPGAVSPADATGIVPICVEPLAVVAEEPRIWGNTIVYADNRGTGLTHDIYKYVLGTGESVVSDDAGDQWKPAIGSDTIVWQDDFNAGTAHIRALIPGKGAVNVCMAAGGQTDPAVRGSTIVWTDMRSYATNNTDIYAWDVTAEQERPVCTESGQQSQPDVFGDTIAYYDYPHPNTIAYADSTGEHLVPNSVSGIQPAIWGKTVLFFQAGIGISAWDPINGTHLLLSGGYRRPRMWGSTVVCDDDRNVYAWDPVHGLRTVVTGGARWAHFADIYGNALVWELYNPATSKKEIYAYLGWDTPSFPDLNGDGVLDDADVTIYTAGWKATHGGSGSVDARCDLDGDGDIDRDAAGLFVEAWLAAHY